MAFIAIYIEPTRAQCDKRLKNRPKLVNVKKINDLGIKGMNNNKCDNLPSIESKISLNGPI